MYAAKGGHNAILRLLLLQPEVDINTPDRSANVGGTPVHWACAGNNPDGLLLLLARPDIMYLGVKDREGMTPLALALSRSSKGCAKLLVEARMTERPSQHRHPPIPVCSPPDFNKKARK